MTSDQEGLYLGIKKLWEQCPLYGSEYDVNKFMSWQGAMFALLSYNPEVQSRFRLSSEAILSRGLDFYPFSRAWSGGLRTDEQLSFDLIAVVQQAIADVQIEPPKEEFILTEEHGVWWYLRHSPGSTLGWIAGTLLTLVVGAFILGFTLGRIAFFQEMHRLITEDKTVPPTTPQASENASTNSAKPASIPNTTAPSQIEEKKE
jgi:hypothetical protein